ncbi:MAG: 50S ribosomal protein L11, partial [Flavobacteriales bacterium]
KQFNAETEEQKGKLLPVEITVYEDASFDFIIKSPPAAAQIMEVSKLEGGSGEPNKKKVGSITWNQIKEIAEDKMKDLNCFSVEPAMKMVAGTARSMGVVVKGKRPF